VVSGNSVDTLNFYITAATGYVGDASVDGILSGIDQNSTIFTSDTAQSSLFLQTPADLSWVSTQPSATQLDSLFQFEVRIFNSGDASIQIDTTQTELVMEGTTKLFFLSDTSDLIIGGNDTTLLIFKEDSIPNLIGNGIYPLTLDLTGLSNQNNYTNSFNVCSID